MAKIPSLKSNPKYKDAPRFKIIYDYEGEIKKEYKDILGKMSLELVKKMKSFVK